MSVHLLSCVHITCSQLIDVFVAKNRNHHSYTPLLPQFLKTEMLTQRNKKVTLRSACLSHHKLWDLIASQIQGKVLVCSLDGKGMLLVDHTGTMIGQALVAIAVTQLLSTAKCVAVCSVLAELCPL